MAQVKFSLYVSGDEVYSSEYDTEDIGFEPGEWEQLDEDAKENAAHRWAIDTAGMHIVISEKAVKSELSPKWKIRERRNEARLDFNMGRLIVTVHRHIDYDPDDWLMTCYGLGSAAPRRLHSKELRDACVEAQGIIQGMLREVMSEIEGGS